MSNPYTEQRNCYAEIDKIIMKLKPQQTIELNDLLIQVLTKYAVSEANVLKFIYKYENSLVIKINDEIITRCEV